MSRSVAYVGTASGTIAGSVDVFANLPTPVIAYTGVLYYVTQGSGGILSGLGVYKYPAGLYVVNSDQTGWELTPINVKVTEDSLTLVSITDWAEFYEYAFDISVNDLIVYQGVTYRNLTGTQTTTPPDTDETNWESNIRVNSISSVDGSVSLVSEGTGDDKGFTVVNGQLAVGTWDNPNELVAGQGDSTTDTAIFYHTDDDVNFTDVTDILISDTGSSIGLFGGTTAGNTIYMGSDFVSSGVKAKIVSDGILDPANVVIEYWDGTQWDSANFMATSSDYPLDQYGWNIASNGNASEQWRVDIDPYQLRDPWVKNTINGVEKYWSRFRIVTDITQDPVIEQIKIHTSRWECNSTGQTEYFGVGRYKKTVMSGIDSLINNAQYSPANENVLYTSDVTANYTDNELAGGALDSKLFIFNVDEGLDTSVKLEIKVSWYVKGTGTGDVELFLEKIPVMDDFVYDGSAVAEDRQTVITTIDTSQNLIRKTATLYMGIPEGDPSTGYVFVLGRDGRATNTNDTLSNNVILTHIVVNGYFWKP